MPEEYKVKMQNLLRRLFQFDVADLDFGIYRIMNQKREQIDKFIEEDIIKTVDKEFAKYETVNKDEKQQELNEIKKKIESNVGPDAILPTGEIKEEYKKLAIAKQFYQKKQEVDTAEISVQQKAEIFSHIYQFFSRYFQDGDFFSLRRYSKENKYVVPYDGEEVILHWANKDQYYIKTGEYFSNYYFKAGAYSVNFKIKNVQIEQNNNKSVNRFFMLIETEEAIIFNEGKKTLTVIFQYRDLNNEEKEKYGTQKVQEKILVLIKNKILASVTNSKLKDALQKNYDSKTHLEKHLNKYVKKNTTDYFIHKNLKGFLERELDFYIKNEMLTIDDLDGEKGISTEKYITRIRVMSAISQKIIEFLAQIEDFQKRLWEKKKFVIKTDYCISLDRIPEEFYKEIIENINQINEWYDLFKLKETEKGTLHYSANGGLKIDVDYLKSHPFLVLDTKLFTQDFKDRLLTTFEDLDKEIDGLLIKSENWQALNLLQDRYKEQVKCIYLDPPYNTGNDGFLYKDNYQHSSWISMMIDRLVLANKIMSDDGVLFSSIDDGECANLRLSCENALSQQAFVADICVVNNLKGRNDKDHIAQANERLLIYKSPNFQEIGFELTEEQKKEYSLTDKNGNHYRLLGLRKRGGADTRGLRPNLFFPIFVNPSNGKVSLTKSNEYLNEVLPLKSDGTEGAWRWGTDSVEMRNDDLIGIQSKGGKWDVFQIDPLFSETGEKRFKPKSVWFGTNYSTDGATKELRKILPDTEFTNPKPVPMITDIVLYSTNCNDIILDFFAGCGTTAHALINLNRDDQSKRKYILVEMANYFDTVMKPRIEKIMYTNDWKEGKPQNTDGTSHIFKYIYLEQYEDTLNNIEFKISETVQKTLKDLDGYFLNYMLDFETLASSVRLNVTKFDRPFEYKLKINNENEAGTEESIDLVETFNYLLGLYVKQIKIFYNKDHYYRVVFGKRENKSIVIIWRNTDKIDLKEDKKFIENTILLNKSADTVYINGDTFLKNAVPIEPVFKKYMGG